MRTPRKPWFYFLCGAGALIALIALLLGAFDFLFGGSEYNVEKVEPSPDGKHFAMVYSGMGGGAAGWCSQYVSVYTKDTTKAIEKGDENYEQVVFDVDCGSQISVRWDSSTALAITYTWGDDSIRITKNIDHQTALSA